MEGLTSRRIAGNLGINLCTASFRMLTGLEHKHPCALGNDEAIAIGGEGPRSALRIVVPRWRHDPHKREPLHDPVSNRHVYAADEHLRNQSCMNVSQGITNRVSRRGTAGGHHMAHSAKAKAHADFAGERPHRAAGDSEQTYLLDFAFIPEAILLFGELLSATARAKNHANGALLLHRQPLRIDSRVGQGFTRSSDCQRDSARNMLALMGIDPGKLVKVLNLACNLHRKRARVKACDPLHTACASQNCATKSLVSNSIWADHAHSCNDHRGTEHLGIVSADHASTLLSYNYDNSMTSQLRHSLTEWR